MHRNRRAAWRHVLICAAVNGTADRPGPGSPATGYCGATSSTSTARRQRFAVATEVGAEVRPRGACHQYRARARHPRVFRVRQGRRSRASLNSWLPKIPITVGQSPGDIWVDVLGGAERRVHRQQRLKRTFSKRLSRFMVLTPAAWCCWPKRSRIAISSAYRCCLL